MSEEPIYFLVTEEELNQIKNDCAFPERFDCEECKYCSVTSDLPCTFIGANALMDEVMTRKLSVELQKEREKVMDEFGILHGEDAKKLYEYMRSE